MSSVNSHTATATLPLPGSAGGSEEVVGVGTFQKIKLGWFWQKGHEDETLKPSILLSVGDMEK